MEEMLWNFGIGSRELTYRFLTGPYSLRVEGIEAKKFKYFILV